MAQLNAAYVDSDIFAKSPLAVIYYGRRGEGYDHNVALWAAWNAHPDAATRAAVNLPTTQKEFAKLLGVSDRTVRNYPHKHPELARQAGALMMNSILADYFPRALEALGETAVMVGKDGTADRRLLFEMIGVYTPRSKADVTSDGELVLKVIYGDDGTND